MPRLICPNIPVHMLRCALGWGPVWRDRWRHCSAGSSPSQTPCWRSRVRSPATDLHHLSLPTYPPSSVRPSVRPYVHPYVHSSIRFSFHPSVRPSVRQSETGLLPLQRFRGSQQTSHWDDRWLAADFRLGQRKPHIPTYPFLLRLYPLHVSV